MKKLKSNSLLDMIKVAVNRLPDGIQKVADKNESEFNETVPAPKTIPVDEQFAQQQGTENVPPKKAVKIPGAPQDGTPEEEYAAMPNEESLAGGIEGTPEELGVRAAQSFIGDDIMAAALQGDPGAADIVSRTAGQVAKAIIEAAGNQQSAVQGTPSVEGGAPVEGGEMGGVAPAGVTTPEEDLANEVVPNVQAQPAEAPTGQGVPPQDAQKSGTEVTAQSGSKPTQGEESAKNNDDAEVSKIVQDENIDPDTVAKIVKLVKSGKL